MIARANVVHQAVALIDPDARDQAQCVNAVHLALIGVNATAADLQQKFHGRTKLAKRAAGRLHKALTYLQDVLRHPDIPEDLWNIFPSPDISVDGLPVQGTYSDFDFLFEHPTLGRGETNLLLMRWLQRANWAMRTKTDRRRFNFSAEKKLIAAEQAHRLLRQFNKKISTTKGSAFCRLAALLHGKPKADFQYPCRLVLHSVKKVESKGPK
jgi:hypothetical protein